MVFAGGRPSEAQLVVYDLDLKEVEWLTVKSGLKDTGQLYRVAREDHVLGNIEEPGGHALYLYDLRNRRLARWVPLDSSLERLTWNATDRTYWGWLAHTLVKVDPATLAVTPVGRLDWLPGRLAWRGRALYATRGSALVRIVIPGRSSD